MIGTVPVTMKVENVTPRPEPNFGIPNAGFRIAPEPTSGWNQQGFQQVNNRFGRVDRQFDRVDRRFDGIDNRIDQLDNRLRRIESMIWVPTGCVIIMTAIVGYVATLARDLLMLWIQQ